ncbi:EamA family transporter [Oryzibacter oryziterrae]|uniref:EamA family transporter n=1 Tax=Oryzibacter oryziterrae TaxID=2766474 RepID=UPI001F300AA9|nr:EamA family transporter [Oryzibacter oryziterrae]
MTTSVAALALLAALLHASWNAFLRTGTDRLWTITVMSLSGTLMAAVWVACVPLPPPEAWPFILTSSLLQVGYSLFLVAAYRQADLGQVYPIVRGTVPLWVTLSTFLLSGQSLEPLQLLGIALVGSGIGGLAFGRGRASTSAIAWALATGMIIACYATLDAIGVRKAPANGSYAAWVQVCFGSMMLLAFLATRRSFTLDWQARETWKAVLGGLIALFSYGTVLMALALGPAGPVMALRETSVVFAALLGRLFLGETLTLGRLTACIVVATGAICLL